MKRDLPVHPHLLVEELERRILYSADAAALLGLDGTLPAAEVRTLQPVAPAQTQASTATAPVQQSPSREIVFIDSRVPDAMALADRLLQQAEAGRTLDIVVLQAGEDGVAQIGRILAQEHGLAAIHIISHGADGAVDIGSTRLDAARLAVDGAAVAQWGQALAAGGDLLLYGCDVAQDAAGQDFVQQLARLTGADVAASSDLSGSAAQGGNWTLEYQTGDIESANALQAGIRAGWSGTLASVRVGSEFIVNATVSGNQNEVAVAMNASGQAVVVWTSEGNLDGDGRGIFGQRFDASGNKVGGEFRVNTFTANDQRYASVAIDGAGNFVVAWASSGQEGGGAGFGTSVQAQRFNADGSAAGAEFRVNITTAGDQTLPAVTMSDTGGFAIAWRTDVAGAKPDIYSRRYDATGTAISGEIVTGTDPNYQQDLPAIAMNGSGAYVVTWKSTNPLDGSGTGVFAQRYSAAGVAQGAVFQVNTTGSGNQDKPTVAITANGDFVIAWVSGNNQDGDKNGVFAQRFNAIGIKQGGEFRVNTTTLDNQDFPTVAMDGSGRFVIAWASNNQDGNGKGIYANSYSAAGELIGLEFRVNSTTSGNQDLPAIAMRADGQYLVAWQGNGPGDGSGIFAQRHQPLNAAPVNTVPGSQVAVGLTPLVFSSATGNAISTTDDALWAPHRVTLSVNGGALTLAGTAGLTFSSGSGSGDASMTFTGTVAAINTALNGLQFLPTPFFSGVATLQIVTDDLGHTDPGGALLDTDTVDIAVFQNGTPFVLSGSYLGNGVDNRNITGLGFQPDVVILKARDDGGVAVIRTSTMTGDASKEMAGSSSLQLNEIQALLADGFNVGTDSTVNKLGKTYDWIAFKASAGVLTVGSYTGNGVAGRSVTGLGFSPDALFVMDGGNQEAVFIDSASGLARNFGSNSPDSNFISALGADGFTLGSDSRTNGSGRTYHYVAWNEVPGLTDVGSYTGNGVDNRNIGGVGFQPEYLIVRSMTVDNAVQRFDSQGTVNDSSSLLTGGSATTNRLQALQPDGFQVGTDSDVNSNGRGYSYIAWRQQTAPTVSAIANQTIDEDITSASVAFTVGDAETAAGSLNVRATSSNPALLADSGIVLGGSGANRTLTLTPLANAYGASTVTVLVSDGQSQSSTVFNLTVTPANDAPVITHGAVATLTPTDEDTVSSGTTVDAILTAASWADVDVSPSKGIAVTAVGGNGSWQYSTDGTTWTGFGAVTASNALLLTAGSQVRYQPDGLNGETATFAFKAWDQTSGTASINGTPGYGNPGAGGGTTAYSSQTASASITVSPVNDAPSGLTAAVFPAIAEDNVSSAGQLVSNFTASTTDPDTGALRGIAVTGVDNSHGRWQYTLDGSSWSDIGTVSTTSALLLQSDATTRVRFVPNANFNGTVAGFSAVAWDRNTGSAGMLVDVSVRGGSTAFSSSGVSVGITVTAVNDAPVASGSATLAAIDEDTVPPGATVGALFGANFSDATDQVAGGSSANTFAGIAISSYTVDAARGQWQYSTDGGSNWISLSGGSTGAAIMLKSADLLRFLPVANGNGPATALAAHLIESGLAVTTGATIDLSGGATGGSSHVSAATVALVHTVNAVNDPPTASNLNAAETYVEDTPLNLVDIVVADVDSASVTATLTLSDPGAGSLNTGTSGLVTSTYIIGTGVWTASGATADVNALLAGLTFTPAANRNGSFSITTHISDGVAAPVTGSKLVTGVAVNDEQVLATNTGMTVAENSIGTVISAATLATTDIDNSAAELVYTLTGAPLNGTLRLAGAALALNSSFTQADIDAGLLRYDHDGSETAADSFGFSVDDGSGSASIGSFAITVTPVNDHNPVITSNGGGAMAMIEIAENTTAVTTVRATDADLPAPTLTYSISGGADAAHFTINGSTGVLRFVSAPVFATPTDAGGDNVYDVTVQVSDGTLTDSQAIAVSVTNVYVNQAPVITSDGGGPTAARSVAENTTAVTTVTANDVDAGTTLVYSISGGADAAKFVIDGASGELRFITAPNFEAPTDADGNNIYELVVQVSDGALTDTQAITVTVTDVNEAPVITSDGGVANATRSVAENSTAVTTVVAADVDAAATLTYSISGGADAAKFQINATTGVLRFITAPNFEAPTDAGGDNVYNVTVRVSDGTLTDTQAIAVTVTDVNEAPVITSDGGGATATRNAAENSTAVTTVVAADVDAGTTLVYSISGGADAAKFQIDAATGALRFITAPNFETPTDAGGDNVYDVTVQASDGALTDTQAIAVTVTDVNEAPTITSDGGGANAARSVAENSTAVTTVTAADVDAGATLVYSISGGADAAMFQINAATGVLSFISAPNFEAPADAGGDNVYDVIVRVSDGTLTDTQAVAVTVTDVNEAPTITSDGGGASAALNVAENSTAVTTVVAADVDAGTTLVYSISGGADAARFAIDGATGALSFVVAPNFETPTDTGGDNVYDVTVRVSDGTLAATQAIAVTVTNVNEAPVITSGGGGASATLSVAENSTAVMTIVAADADAGTTLTYSISGGADAARFTIDASSGVLRFLSPPDFEAPADAGGGNVYDVTVQVSDGTLTDTQAIAVTVTDVNEAPVITSDGGGASATRSVAENSTAVTTVVAADVDAGATLTYSISGGADAAKFQIDAATGVLRFITAPNFESPADAGGDNVYDVTVQVSDGTLTDTQAIAVTVTDVNEAPVITSDGGGAGATRNVAENSTAVTTVVAADVDAGTTLVYSISGGADAAKFQIDAATGVLRFIAAPNFEAPADAGGDNVYDVTVQVSDGTLTDTQAIAVTVTDVNEAPVITSDGGGASATRSVAENSTAVTTVVATDVDAGATLTYSISGGADAAKFQIDAATGVLRFITAPNFEAPADAGGDNVYDVTVQVSDGTLTDTQAIAVTVTDVNEAPVITSDGGGASATRNVAENSTAVTTVVAADVDAGTTLVYSISGGADAAKFQIDAATGVLRFIAAPNFEAPTDADGNNIYELVVQVSDGTLTDTQAIAVTVTDVNEAPVITSDGGGASATRSVTENSTAVTTVVAADVDAGTTLVYSISGGADAAHFTINGSTGVLRFVSAPVFATPTDAGGDNVYDVTVQVSDGTLTDSQAIAVSVTNVYVNQAPVITSDGGGPTAARSVAENTTAVTTVTANDVDAGTTLVYSISGGADAAKFVIDGASGELRFITAPNFEAPTDADGNNIYELVVQVSDGALTDTQAITVTVTDVNEAPVITSDGGVANATRSVAENSTAVTTVVAADVDAAATLTYSISGGADAAKFQINATTGVLRFITAPNFEAPTDAGGDNIYNVTVRVSDGTLTDTQAIAVTVTDVNEAPVITSDGGGVSATRNVAENSTAVTTVVAADVDAGTTLVYSISGGADAAKFQIDAATGALRFITAPNFETPTDAGGDNVYDVTVQVSDGTLTDTQAIAVIVTDVNEAPTITSDGGGASATRSVAENTTAVATVTAVDVDAGTTLVYSISGGADAAKFQIDAATGALRFIAAPNFKAPTDAGGNNVYDVTVRVSDGTLTDTQSIAVTVTDVNEAPVITSDGGGANATRSVAENTTAVTTVVGGDVDAGTTLVYSISGGADAAKFQIDAATGALRFITAPNFEAPTDAGSDNIYNVTVRVSDGTLTATQAIAVSVTDVNEAPVITSDGGGATATRSVAENTTAVTTVVAADVDAGTTLVYSISGGADAAKFQIDAATGALRFITAPNFEAPTDAGGDNTYNVTVRVSDGTLTATQAIAVSVTDVNEAPVITSDGGGASATRSVAENSTAVTTVVAADVDAGATLTYSISGGADAAKFQIDAATGVLRFITAPNFEAPTDAGGDNTYNVTVRVNDGTLTATQAIAVTVTDVNEAPVITSDGGGASATRSVAENSTAVTTVVAADVDAAATLTYSISGGADAAKFQIDATTGVLRFITAPNFEAPTDAGGDNTYNVTVRVNDGTLTATQAIAVTVTDVNEAPVLSAVESAPLAYSENAAATPATAALAVGDVDGNPLVSATVRISANYVSGQDMLSFVDQNGITGRWHAGTGVLTLSGSASAAQYQAALRSVAYFNTSDDPSTALRTVSFVVNDGSLDSNTVTRDIAVAAVNDAPVTGDVTLPGMAADGAPRVITQGALLAAATDVDGPGLTAVGLALAAPTGTLVDNGNGTWTFSPGSAQAQTVEFSYLITDGMASTAATARLSVAAAAPAPAPQVPSPLPLQPAPSPAAAPAAPAAPVPAVEESGAEGSQKRILRATETDENVGREVTVAAALGIAVSRSVELPQSAAAVAAVRAATTEVSQEVIAPRVLQTRSAFDLDLRVEAGEYLLRVSLPAPEFGQALAAGALRVGVPGGDTGGHSKARDDSDDAGAAPVIAQVAQASGLALTVGTVWWALRAGGLAASLLGALPAWRHIDLLAVLPDEDAKDAWSPDADADAEGLRDERAVDEMLAQRPQGEKS